ncbi:MAG: hypothetical protein ACFWUE_08815 [Xylanivirga thermophila]|jgi:hypothetical protein|uniref:hypothetical protein n=1 Tax=Xylanivirga thermophila TaxID=2496273 RepID=UPI00101B869F|nr:hypothetical protein [Xylanivirga thermophila]
MTKRILPVNKVGICMMVLALFLGYGSKFITQRVLNLEGDSAVKINIGLKIAGNIFAILGMLKIFGIL